MVKDWLIVVGTVLSIFINRAIGGSNGKINCADYVECSVLLDEAICQRWFGNPCKRKVLGPIVFKATVENTDTVPSPFRQETRPPRPIGARRPSAATNEDVEMDSDRILARIRALLQCEEAQMRQNEFNQQSFTDDDHQPRSSISTTTTIDRNPLRRESSLLKDIDSLRSLSAEDTTTTNRRTTSTTTTTTRRTTSTTTTALSTSTKQSSTSTSTTSQRSPTTQGIPDSNSTDTEPSTGDFSTIPPATQALSDKVIVIDAAAPLLQQFYEDERVHLAHQPTPLRQAKVPVPRFNAAAAYFRGNIYLMGGRVRNNVSHSNMVDIYNAAEGRWFDGPRLNVGRSLATATVVANRTLIICGCGSRRSNCAYTCEKLQGDMQAWTIFNVPNCAVNSAVASVGDKMYLTGGDCSTPLSSVLEYNIDSELWSAGVSMSQPRLAHAIAAVTLHEQQFLLTCGGLGPSDPNNLGFAQSAPPELGLTRRTAALISRRTDAQRDGLITYENKINEHLTNCELFDVTRNKWVPFAGLLVPRARLGLLQIGDKIYAIGGVTRRGRALRRVEVFMPFYDKWKNASWNLAAPTYSHAVLVVPETL